MFETSTQRSVEKLLFVHQPMSRGEQMHTNMRKLARAYELKKKEWFTTLERFKNYGIRNMNDI